MPQVFCQTVKCDRPNKLKKRRDFQQGAKTYDHFEFIFILL